MTVTVERMNSRALRWIIVAGSSLVLAAFAAFSAFAASRTPKLDASAAREAFLQVYKEFTCQNCHPAGDSPLQGDDSHVHLPNVKRGKDGLGVYGMRCNTCERSEANGRPLPTAIA